jgi:hypothetical protein
MYHAGRCWAKPSFGRPNRVPGAAVAVATSHSETGHVLSPCLAATARSPVSDELTTAGALAPRPCTLRKSQGSALRGPSFVAAALTIIGGRPAVAARVPAVCARPLPVVGSVGARLDGHLRLILCKRISYCGVQITPGGRLVARLGGAVALVRSPVVLIPFVRGRHRGSLARANERPRPSWRTRGCLQAQCAGHYARGGIRNLEHPRARR